MNQQTIFDITEKRKNDGIELVWSHADTHWKREAGLQLQKIVNSNMPYFTSDDILQPLETRGITTGDNRAIAALLKAAQKVGLIQTTDRFIRCKRKSRHGAPIMQWAVVKNV